MKATSNPGNGALEIGFGYGSRAPYACDPSASRGRLIPENDSPTRTAFQRDRDRIVHATAFRRLKHKTQVFVANDGDHYRTRLTHTIEVSQIARSLARAFRLDEDLAEAVALAHDLGHTPFGHAGERALAEKMDRFGGFDHNTQSLRIVTELERRYAEFDGLNLSFETLEGIVKHNGPLKSADNQGHQGHKPSSFILEYDARQPLQLEDHASLEAQCAAIADDIAYDSHDIDDGLRSGFFHLEDLRDLTLVGDHLAELEQRYPDLEEPRLIHEIARRQITAMIEDVIAESAQRIASERPASSDAVRRCGRQLVGFSQEMQDADRTITQFLFDRLYRHPDMMKITGAAEGVVSQLFDLYMERPDAMGVGWDEGMEHAETHARARRVADYLSGMTDTYALKAYKRLGCRPEWVSPLIDDGGDFI